MWLWFSECLKELFYWPGSYFSQLWNRKTNCCRNIMRTLMEDSYQGAKNNQTFHSICVHPILKFLLFFQSHRGNTSCIIHPVVINYKKGCGSRLWISSSFGVCKPVFNVIALLFCGFLSSTSTAFVWRAFSKIKHLPHWQHFWIFICQILHTQTTWSQIIFQLKTWRCPTNPWQRNRANDVKQYWIRRQNYDVCVCGGGLDRRVQKGSSF